MKTASKCLIFLASVACMAACQDQIDVAQPTLDGGEFTVSFKTGSAVATKSALAMQHSIAKYDVEGSELELCETVQKIDDLVETKGIPVYTSNIANVYPSLAVTAFNVKEFCQWGSSDVKFDTNESGVYSHNYSKGQISNLSWPDEGETDLRFFVRAPYYESAGPCSNVAYTLTASSAVAEFAYSTPADAATQKDVLFGSGQISFEKKTDASNNIELYHVLTGVKFKVSDKVITDKIEVTKVEFIGVISKANCKVETYASGKNSEDVVAWTVPGTPVTANYSQEFDGLVTATGEEGFAESFYDKDLAKNNLNDEDFSLMFWFIPQNLDNITAKITYTINGGNPQTGIASFGTGKSWKAGEIHTYTLSLKGAGVDIDDDVEGQVKSNVVITNTGNMPEYIRVAVVANWVDAAGSTLQSMVPVLDLENNWVLNGRYYYYTQAIDPGMCPADPIFKKYTAPVADAPEGADHLEMSIAVQAIDAQAEKSYITAWGKAGIELK